MNFKKNFKRFFTLSRSADGFTLVELIVVIAILAILGGVAVPAYSGYVKKANMQADISLASEIGNALVLGYYGGTINGPVAVKLGSAGVLEIKGDGVDVAMAAVFGENWEASEAIRVKYDGWGGMSGAGSYADTGYVGNEEELLNEVNMLTKTLSNMVSNGNFSVYGSGMETFMAQNPEWKQDDPTTVGNAAVLYVANTTANNKETIRNTVSDALKTGDEQEVIDAVFGMMGNEDVGSATSVATMYALIEGYAQYCGENAAATFHKNTASAFDGVTDVNGAANALTEALQDLGTDKLTEYMQTQAMKDLDGYLNIMETIDSNSDMVKDNIDKDTCFTDGTVANALGSYKTMGSLGVQTNTGEIAVALDISENGPVVRKIPFEMNN